MYKLSNSRDHDRQMVMPRTWNIAEARSHFSEIVRRASEEPQLIVSRTQPVAAIVSTADLAELNEHRRQRQSTTLAARLAEIRVICEQEDYQLPVVRRRDRRNPLTR